MGGERGYGERGRWVGRRTWIGLFTLFHKRGEVQKRVRGWMGWRAGVLNVKGGGGLGY